MRYRRPFVFQLFERDTDAFAAEVVDWQVFNHAVFAVFAHHGQAEDKALGDAVGAVSRHAHGYPMAVAAEHPVADVFDGGVGG